jgi:long-subunit fatty acid transport protein
MVSIKKIIVFFSFSIMVLSMSTFVSAKLYEQIPLNAKALSLANAVTANPPGHMAIHYNPAGLSFLGEGVLYSQGFSMAGIIKKDQFKADPTVGINDTYRAVHDPVSDAITSGHARRVYFPWIGDFNMPFSMAPVPISFSYRQPYSKWTFAMGMYMPESWGYCHASGDPARFQGKSYYQQHLVYASPSISYQLSDRCSIGLSVAVGQSALGMNTDLRLVSKSWADFLKPGGNGLTSRGPKINTFDKIAELDLSLRDDFAPSFNVGLIIEPFDQVTIAMSYNSPIYRRLKGDFKLSYSNKFLNEINYINPNNGTFHRLLSNLDKSEEIGKTILNNYYHPQQINLGIMFKANEHLRIIANANWKNWSSINKQLFEFSRNIDLFSIFNYGYDYPNNQLSYKRDFDDVLNWGIGIEYQIKESLCIRMGYERRPYGGQKEYFDLYTSPTTNLIAAGFGIKQKNRVTIDFGMGYIFSSTYNISSGTSENMNATPPLRNPYYGQNYTTSVQAFLLSLNISMPFETISNQIKGLAF